MEVEDDPDEFVPLDIDAINAADLEAELPDPLPSSPGPATSGPTLTASRPRHTRHELMDLPEPPPGAVKRTVLWHGRRLARKVWQRWQLYILRKYVRAKQECMAFK